LASQQPARFDADWLVLRERLDHAARSRALAAMLAQRLPPRPRLIDLGAGTGNLFRFVAPLIARPQAWIFADADRSLLELAIVRTADWAKKTGFDARPTAGAPALDIDTPTGPWRIQTRIVDLSRAPRGLGQVDAVVCSALLDLVSRDWMERLFAGLRVPFYASLTVDGRDAWYPRHRGDLAVRLAFRRDQRRDKGLGIALGSDASRTAEELLVAAGFEVFTATADWRIARGERRLARLLTRMTAEAAHWAMPLRTAAVATWARTRRAQANLARLSIRIGHGDILAFPPRRSPGR
jgi:hypothetical protein